MKVIKLSVDELEKGMYVSRVDKPWLETPFMFQGFPIRTDEEIEQLRACCKIVYIDIQESHDWHPDEARISERPKHRFATHRLNTEQGAHAGELHYTLSFEEELENAKQVFHSTKKQIQHVFHDIQLGNSTDLNGIRDVTTQLVDSVVRNENALLWLTQLKNKDEYTSVHSINVCVLSLLFGRYLGLPEEELYTLGLGALLHDIGKIRIPDELLNKMGKPTPAEMKLLRYHPSYGREILSKKHNLPEAAVQIAYSHHERFDGSGYPRGLKGKDIPPLAMLVSVVDVYDAITTDRIYHHGISPHEALNLLYDWSPKHFPEDLIELFIECLGIYPVGSIVELEAGEVGVVVTTNRRNHLCPIIIQVLDHDKNPMTRRTLLDLELQQRAGKPKHIKRILKSHAYQIEPRKIIHEEFLGADW